MDEGHMNSPSFGDGPNLDSMFDPSALPSALRQIFGEFDDDNRSLTPDLGLEDDDDWKEGFSPDREVQEVFRNELNAASGGCGFEDGKPMDRRKRKSGDSPRARKEVGIRWDDESRKSAFTPYRPSTLLTNLSRGNVKTQSCDVGVEEVSLYHLAAQGELTAESLQGVDVGVADADGLTLLMWAAAYGQARAVELLLAHGADPDQRGTEDRSALLFAAAGGHVECVKRLVRSGADVDQHDENWNTPLMYACFGDHALCVNELLALGAEVTAENLCDDSAYDICCKNNADAAKTVLEKHFLKVLAGRLNEAVPRMPIFSQSP